uniref:Putative na+:iodide/myo-inositol/multivitamin symporter n=1 Tax=Ixodes ricinus TaxID=34613 RepID=A0A0K8RMF7_IXORI
MTAIAIAIPYLGSVIRVFMGVYGSISGPFVGLYLLALAFPWVNAKGAAVSAIFTMALQIWAVAGKLEAGIHPPRMPVTLDYCPQNITTEMILNSTSAPSTPDVHGTKPLFLLYRLSSNWSGFFAMLLTIAVGLGVSILTGENRYTGRNVHLTSDVFLKLWKKMRLLSDFDAEEQPGGNCTGEQLQVFTVTRHITAKRNDTKQSRWENVRNTSHNRFQI